MRLYSSALVLCFFFSIVLSKHHRTGRSRHQRWLPGIRLELGTGLAAGAPVGDSSLDLGGLGGMLLPLTGSVSRSSARTRTFRNLVPGAKLDGVANDKQYSTSIKVGNQSFDVIVDSGSSDLWVVSPDFDCFNETTGRVVPQPLCRFPPGGYRRNSPTYRSYPDHRLNIRYGSGQSLSGPSAFETVQVGPLVVENQQFSIATRAAWTKVGDGVTSGLLGLGPPNATSVFRINGNNSAVLEPYQSFFYNAVAQNKTAPFFSMVLNRGSEEDRLNSTRDPNLGYVGLGAVPPVPTTGRSVTVDIEGFYVSPNGTRVPADDDLGTLFYYTIDVDAYVVHGSPSGAPVRALLDSGAALTYVPTEVYKHVLAQYHPSSWYNATLDLDVIDCNSTAPAFAVQIGGQDFVIPAEDMVVPMGYDSAGTPICASGVADAGDSRGVYILGATFMHNVVTTYHIDTNTIDVLERRPYTG